MIVSIHQPNYIPWPGFFHKILTTDMMILLDQVQYDDKSFSNRNRIKTPQGPKLLSVPVRLPHYDLRFKDVLIDPVNTAWSRKHIRTLQTNYRKAAHFEELEYGLVEIYDLKWNLLVDLNVALIEWILSYLDVRTKLIRASELNVEGKGNELLLEICRAVGADEFLSGSGARGYIRPEIFEASRVRLRFQHFALPPYPQLYGNFVSNLSILDMLFNLGKSTKALIMEVN